MRNYLPQIDSLRFFAALGVVNLHWCNVYFEGTMDWSFGKYGVQLFFVLSGFLITRILIQKKREQAKRSTVIKSFFMRRVLRLFPIYYLFLLYLILVKDEFVVNHAAYFFTYTANFVFTQEGLVDQWSNHVWTLCIEEQFYLLFPWIILFIRRKWEYPFALLFLAIGLGTKTYAFWFDQPFLYFSLPAQVDMLGAGVLLGLFWENRAPVLSWLDRWSALLVLLLVPAFFISHYTTAGAWRLVIFTPILIGTCVVLVHKTAIGFKTGPARIAFDNPLTQYLGKISYGIYLYHKIIPLSLFILLPRLGISINNFYLEYALNFSILILGSILSWHIVEKPLLRLKRHFKYSS